MFKVLLVDDERIILDGISRMVNWATLGTDLVGTAQNGLQAYEMIERLKPDIVVSDIRMPGLDGLKLTEKTQVSHPDIKFVILSGFGEFDYAKQAMKHGVKHYLLKPTNELKIAEAIASLVEELSREARKESFVRSMKGRLDKMMPHVKEQVLKEFVTNKTYGSRDWDYYRSLFAYEFDSPVRLLLFQLEGAFEFEHLFAIKNIAEELLPGTLLSTTIGDHVLVLIEDWEQAQQLHDHIHDVRSTFLQYYKMDVTISLSDPGRITQARSLYQETLQGLTYRFYLGEGSLITRKDTEDAAAGRRPDPTVFSFDEERLSMLARSGHLAEAEQALDGLFDRLKQAQLDIDSTKSYVIQQFVSLYRQADPQRMNLCYQQIPQLAEMSSLQSIRIFMEDTVRAIARRNYEVNAVKHTAIIRRVIEIIKQQLGNAELSLNLVAHEMLYMNADYLGKLFKKETGEKFTNYVMKMRIQQATELISSDPDIKIFELAERLGFGDNPQYFSQVFKKQMGCTPSEFMKKPNLSALHQA